MSVARKCIWLVMVFAVAAGMWLSTSPAGATEHPDPHRPLWQGLGCGTAHHQVTFAVVDNGLHRDVLVLHVSHVPGRFGTIEVKRKISWLHHEVSHQVWRWSQPITWIYGGYSEYSPKLPVGHYVADYWASNRLQHESVCKSWLVLSKPRS